MHIDGDVLAADRDGAIVCTSIAGKLKLARFVLQHQPWRFRSCLTLSRQRRTRRTHQSTLEEVLSIALELSKHLLVVITGAKFEPNTGPIEFFDGSLADFVPCAMLCAALLGGIRGPVSIVKEHFETCVLARELTG